MKLPELHARSLRQAVQLALFKSESGQLVEASEILGGCSTALQGYIERQKKLTASADSPKTKTGTDDPALKET